MAEDAGGGEGRHDSARQDIKVIGGYELLARLGRGAMGAVYKARQTSLDRVVALKLLPPGLARDPQFVERFLREARAAGRLSHPNIVGGIDVGTADGFYYFAMEYVEGETLRERMARDGRYSEREAARIGAQVARGLAHAHTHGMIHRDVKPHNVILTKNGTAKLCDLGLARSTQEDQSLTLAGTALGTPYYISPEQVEGREGIDGRADLYSLGATLYDMLAGRPPFMAPTGAKVMAMHLTDPPPPLREFATDVSAPMTAVIGRLLQKDPARRYPSAAALAEDLESLAAGKAPKHLGSRPAAAAEGATAATHPLKPVAGGRPAWKSGPVLAGTAAAAVLFLATGVWLVMRDGGHPPPPVVTAGPGKPPEKPPPPPEDKDKQFREAFEYAQEQWRKAPENYEAAAGRFRKVAADAAGTKWALMAEDAIGEIQGARKKSEDDEFARMKAEGLRLVEGGDYDGALAALSKPSDKFAAALSPRLKSETEALRKAAGEKLLAIHGAAEKFSKDGEPDKGLAELDKAATLKYAPWAGKLAALRARLEDERKNSAELARKRRLAEAHKRRDTVLDEFDARMLAGKFADAGDYVAAEKAKLDGEALAAVGPELAAAGKAGGELVAHEAARRKALDALAGTPQTLVFKVGQPLGCTVTRVLADGFEVEFQSRIGDEVKTRTRTVAFKDLSAEQLARLLPPFEPKTVDGCLGAALAAMGRGDLERAGRMLASVGEHPLSARYVKKLELLKLGAVEFAAREAWETQVKPLAKDKLSVEEAKKLLDALNGFFAAQGTTKCAAEVKPEADRLRALAEKTIDESPEGLVTKVKKLWRGKVVRFDPKTLEIEILYDFEDVRQLEDWELSEFAAGGLGGRTMKIENGKLHLIETGRCALLNGIFTSVAVSADIALVGGQGNVTLIVCANELGDYYNVFGLQEGAKSYLEKYVRGTWTSLGQPKPSPLAAAHGGPLALSFADGVIRGQAGDLVMEAKDKTYASGRVGFWSFSTNSTYDNFRVVGRLDRTWLEIELRRQAARVRPAPAFNGEWRLLNLPGENPPGRAMGPGGLTYDSKRKACVLYGGCSSCSAPNDLWALDLAAGRWSCLQKGSPPKDPAVNVSRPPTYHSHDNLYLSYDEAHDLYWLYFDWAYDPAKAAWQKAKPIEIKTAGMPACPPVYDPDGKRFFKLGSSAGYAPACAFVQLAEGKGEDLAPPPFPPRYIYSGMAYDRKNKVFVLFSSHTPEKDKPAVTETWIFDPAAGQWRRGKPQTSPPARSLHKLVWDDKLGALVLFGGSPGWEGNGPKFVSDLWVYETAADRWTEARAPSSPPGCGAAAAYDAANDALVVYNSRGQTWALKLERVEK